MPIDVSAKVPPQVSTDATQRPGPQRHVTVSRNILDAIGDTPLLEIDGIFVKLEFLNPSGSIKARIAHYMKAIMRDKIGSFASRENVEDFLNTWLAQYVLLDDSASQEAKAKYPLREARVDVVEVPGKPGVYRAAAFLRPHFQLDELTISLRLVSELPKAVR